MKVPPINASLEGAEFLNWVKEQLLGLIGSDQTQGADIASILKKLGMAAGSATDTSVQVETNRTDIIELKARAGLPEGGGPGMTVTRDSTGLPVWTSVPYAVVPEYWIYLAEGDPQYATNGGDVAITGLPVPRFADDGTTLLPLYSVDGSEGEAPVNLSITVFPTADDQTFKIYLPVVGSLGGGAPPYFTLALWNSTEFTANVQLLDTQLYYAGTTTKPYTPGAGTRTRVLEPYDYVNWWVQGGGNDSTTATVTPLANRATLESSDALGYRDRFYTLNVASMRYSQTFSAMGELELVASGAPFRNGDEGDVKALGKVVASVRTAPTGASILIDVKRNGTSVFTSPLEIPAGATTASKVPDVFTGTNDGFTGPASWGIPTFEPDDVLTVGILQVGSSTPGSDLTVQVYYG